MKLTILEAKMSPATNDKFNQNKNVKVGFEIECVLEKSKILTKPPPIKDDDDIMIINDEYVRSWRNYVRTVTYKINHSPLGTYFDHIDYDGSIDIKDKLGLIALEIITKPIPYEECIEYFKNLISYLQKEFNLHTNESCGLHINISTNNTTQDKIDMCKLWVFLGEKHFLSQFNRIDNSYARSLTDKFSVLSKDVLTQSKIQNELKQVKQSLNNVIKIPEKYSTVNTIKLKHNYLEVRIAGGANYEQQMSKITDSIKHFTTSILIAGDPTKLTKLYNIKLIRLIEKIRQDMSVVRHIHTKMDTSGFNDTEIDIIDKAFTNLLYLFPSLGQNHFTTATAKLKFIKNHFVPEVLSNMTMPDKRSIMKLLDKVKIRRSLTSDIDWQDVDLTFGEKQLVLDTISKLFVNTTIDRYKNISSVLTSLSYGNDNIGLLSTTESNILIKLAHELKKKKKFSTESVKNLYRMLLVRLPNKQ